MAFLKGGSTMPQFRFRNRNHAGEALAEEISQHRFDKPVVLALPRGGVPVAIPVARALNAPLDLVMAKKIGMPGHEEFAVGAIVDGKKPHLVINPGVLESGRLSREQIDALAKVKLAEIERRKREYGTGDPVNLKGRCAIIVDDGIATGASAKAAIEAVRAQSPETIILAIPVAPKSTVAELAKIVDEVICLRQPQRFYAVGVHYMMFNQVSDANVKHLMQEFRLSQTE